MNKKPGFLTSNVIAQLGGCVEEISDVNNTSNTKNEQIIEQTLKI
jgi:hypothetical protein